MARKICIASLKGGVNKTTLAVHLAASSARSGRRTLLIDLDPQANATMHFNEGLQLERSAYDWLSLRCDAQDAIAPAQERQGRGSGVAQRIPGLDFMPSSLKLAFVGYEMQRSPQSILNVRAELDALDYEIIVLDTPPAIDYPTRAGLYAADLVLSPTELKHDSILGISYIARLLDDLYSPNIRLKRPEQIVVPSCVNAQQAAALREDLGARFHVSQVAITRSEPVNSTMIKKTLLDAEAKGETARSSYAEFQGLLGEVA